MATAMIISSSGKISEQTISKILHKCNRCDISIVSRQAAVEHSRSCIGKPKSTKVKKADGGKKRQKFSKKRFDAEQPRGGEQISSSKTNQTIGNEFPQLKRWINKSRR